MGRVWRRGWVARVAALLCAACSANGTHGDPRSSPDGGDVASGSDGTRAEAGFVELGPRDVVIHGRPVSLAATSRIFYNFRPADQDPKTKPILILFNGFASDTVRPFGTGPFTVERDGRVVPNSDSLTELANLLYIDPRQSGFSYDLITDRAPTSADCSQDVFNEYVDAADVLLASLRFVETHDALTGPVYFMGESYAGVRISWMLAYLRQAWALAPYQDSTLQTAVASQTRARFLHGQILLQPWLAGAAHTTAISDVCATQSLLAAVQSNVGTTCPTDNACACANSFGRSPYNYTFTTSEQNSRIFAADAAQVAPADAQAIYGVTLDSIPQLRASERARGFKCSVADDSTPDESELVALLGALPPGQNYNLAYSPLQPGKGSSLPDWRQLTLIGAAFLDNLRTVDTFLTDGQRDLVVPESALVPALKALASGTTISETSARVTVAFPSGVRSIDIGHYPAAGHMITMIEPHELKQDLQSWLTARPD
ncbi:MAG TPA: hypothetical protein VIM73_21810 [Polyangiaceae bacterium]